MNTPILQRPPLGQILMSKGILSEDQLRIALLERGREYLAGAFPGRFAELPAHLRWSTPAGLFTERQRFS
mgnify:CR=1 FL=1